MYEIETSYWWFLGKRYLIDFLLKTYLSHDGRNRLLDVGCGTGLVLELMKSHGPAFGIELSGDAISFLRRRNLNLVVQSDASQALPFKNDVFSIITCLDVLEHLRNDIFLVEEMFRICKPGGFIIITAPAMNCLWSEHDEALHHKRRYTKKELLNRLVAVNCHVKKATYFNTSLFMPIFAIRKIKAIFKQKSVAQSDFFIPLPGWVNACLYFFYSKELTLLKSLTFPFGVSLLAILQKQGSV